MNKKKISKIIAKKTSLYLKISMSLFVLSLVLLTTAVIFVQQQYMQLRNKILVVFFICKNIYSDRCRKETGVHCRNQNEYGQ